MKTGALIVFGTVVVSLVSTFVLICSVANTQDLVRIQTPISASAPKT